MSSVSRWAYKNTATVRPFVEEDGEAGGIIYGPEYTIACTWSAEAKAMREASAPAGNGEEFVSAYLIYTEDARPQYRDMIKLNDPTIPDQEIRARTVWDMAMFNDTPDYLLVT